MVAQCIETADEEGLWSTFWEETESRARTAHASLAAATSLSEREHLAGILETLARDARVTLQAAFMREAEARSRSAGSVDATPKNDTEGSHDPFVSAQRSGGSCSAPPSCPVDIPATAEPEGRIGIDPIEIARLVPELRARTGPAPTWGDLGHACEALRAQFEIGHRLWDRAHAALGGPQRRIIAFADLLTYPDEHFAKGRGAYFAGMVKLAEAGRLNLGSSLYGMRKRGGPDKPWASVRHQKTDAGNGIGAIARRLHAWPTL